MKAAPELGQGQLLWHQHGMVQLPVPLLLSLTTHTDVLSSWPKTPLLWGGSTREKKQDPRGAKPLLSPKSEPLSPKGHWPTPRTDSLPARQTRQWGTLLSPPKKWARRDDRWARTDAFQQDSRTWPHTENSTVPRDKLGSWRSRVGGKHIQQTRVSKP